MMISFGNFVDVKDMLTESSGRELRPLPKTEEELQALIQKAESGDDEAACDLGHFYRAEANAKLEYFKSHISAGSPNMRAPYCVVENAPFSEVVAEERENAFRWFQKSAELGNVDALYELSHCYEHGFGTAKHWQKGQELLMQAANRGYAPAQYEVGMQFYFGESKTAVQDLNRFLNTKQDYKQAALWLKKAAEQDYGLAQYHLGLCYESGDGVKKNEEEAFCWFKKAAERELPWAVVKLGECYENGVGVLRDEAVAATYYRQAAELGDTAGMCNLGRCYEEGIGVEKDLDRAIEWYEAASNEGDEQAFDALDRLREE